MTSLYTIPSWFLGFDITLEFLFAIVTAIIAILAAKISSISKEKNVRYFSRGFLCISISYLIWAVVNASIVKEITSGTQILVLEKLSSFWLIGIYIYMFLFITGLVTLVYATLNIKRTEIYYLLLAFPLIALAGAYQKIVIFRLLSVFLLSFMVYHNILQYLDSKKKNLIFVTSAFSLLLISHLAFIFFPVSPYIYVLSHFVELVAYALFTFTLTRALTKKQ